MAWTTAEAAIRAYIEAQWALGAYPAVPLQFENDTQTRATTFVHLMIEGLFAEKGIYGGSGKRGSVEHGIIFIHAFVPKGDGKATATNLVDAMTTILELKTLAAGINAGGGDPPSPIDSGDGPGGLPYPQPGGNYYRCSGSVPFIVIGTR